MLVAFLIMLREGIEAALIVGIIAGYLKQTGREDRLPSVWFGVAFLLVFWLALRNGGARDPWRWTVLVAATPPGWPT